MIIIPSKQEFLYKNWEGEHRWRRAELENFANELNIELYTEDTNRDIFERILIEMIKQNEKDEIKKVMLNNPKISKLYVKFIDQLPDIDILQKNWNKKIDYEFFVKHNIENFFLQNKPSFDFLEYFLKNQIYNIKDSDNFIPQITKYIFFHPDGTFTIM